MTYPPIYACMDPMNRAPSYAMAQCMTCGCPSDLVRVGLEFTCRLNHEYWNWDDELEMIVERAEPAA
jgi:hypothetical protein